MTGASSATGGLGGRAGDISIASTRQPYLSQPRSQRYRGAGDSIVLLSHASAMR